ARVRSSPHWCDGAEPWRLLRAAGRRARAALRLLCRLGGAMGLSRHLGEATRRTFLRQGALPVGAAGASAVGARGVEPGGGTQEARSFPARRHRAEDDLSVPASAWRGR